MIVAKTFTRSFQNPVGRWAAVGPYYAMFPLEFAFDVVNQYSKPGQLVIDPFAGRASSVYAAATQGRHGLGIEINSLGWVYALAKLNPAPEDLLVLRLADLINCSDDFLEKASELPDFFLHCYSKRVRAFLLAARATLDWRENRVDRTLMAFLIIYLHGKIRGSLSNQMPITKATGPAYSIRWWKERKLRPPQIDCNEFFLSRIRWRYGKGIPDITPSNVILGDSTEVLEDAFKELSRKVNKRCSLLFTSPPYCGVTDYEKDQWLRLWLLGGPAEPLWPSKENRGRFQSKIAYRDLLKTVFDTVAPLMDKHATIYVRTDSREFTQSTTLEILGENFPKWKKKIVGVPVSGRTQTNICGNKSSKPGEVDIILSR